jgi:hypothetical protein
MEAKIEKAWLEVVADQDPDTSYLEQNEFADRREEHERGDFGFVGVQACAEVRFETKQGGWILGPVVRTPGLWSIESDSGEDYFREVGEDEAEQLEEMLQALGIRASIADYARRVALTKINYR